MSCDEFRSRLQDYVTRELGPEERRQLDAHLLECAECQHELAVMTAIVSTLDHQPVMEPSPEFASKVIAGLPRQRRFVPSLWWAVALTAVLAGVGFLLRTPVKDELARLVARINVGNVTLPTITTQQAWMGAAAVIGFGLLVTVAGAVFCWEAYLRD